MTKAIDIVKKNQTDTPRRWKASAEWRLKNRKWLRYSQEIALRALDKMASSGLTQKALAEKMGCSQQYVSLLLKGSENLTLETISKLETALEIDLIGQVLGQSGLSSAKEPDLSVS